MLRLFRASHKHVNSVIVYSTTHINVVGDIQETIWIIKDRLWAVGLL